MPSAEQVASAFLELTNLVWKMDTKLNTISINDSVIAIAMRAMDAK